MFEKTSRAEGSALSRTREPLVRAFSGGSCDMTAFAVAQRTIPGCVDLSLPKTPSALRAQDLRRVKPK